MNFDPGRLEDAAALERADPGGMLRNVASSAAQVRSSRRAAVEAGLSRLAGDGRPRTIVVAGMGGSGVAGEVLAAACGNSCRVPIVTVRDYQLPGWMGPADLVLAVSCSGATEETLAVAREAVRRGCRLVGIGKSPSPLADIARQANAPFVAVKMAGQPRATLWALSVPLVVAAQSLGLIQIDDKAYEDTALRLEEIAQACRPSGEGFVNPGKSVALALAEKLPMIWGSSRVAAAAAYRFACQLNENAKHPALYGELPEAAHNQVVAFDGPEAPRLHLVLLRDPDEPPQVARRVRAAVRLAGARGIAVSELVAAGTHPLERLASLIGVVDYATVYLALGYGIDPVPVAAIDELKAEGGMVE